MLIEDIQPSQIKTLEVGSEIIGVLNVEEKYSGIGMFAPVKVIL